VLSQFTGAAKELDRALVVNPHEIDDVAAAQKRGLEMPLAERRQRHAPMLAHLMKNDISNWAEDYLSALNGESAARRLFAGVRTLFGPPLEGTPAVTLRNRAPFAPALAVAQPVRGPVDQSSCGQLAGVPICPVRPSPTSITIARMKSGARKRAHACSSATRASITSPPALATIA